MRILIPMGVGAVIGYFTNWLAIKMLFRPYNEIKFLGFSLPFTPGLIPKERKRIAKSIGDTVGQHLLSPKTIIEAFDQKTEVKVREWLEGKIREFKTSKTSFKELLSKISPGFYHDVKEKVEDTIQKMLVSKIRDEKFKENLFTSLELRLTNLDLDKTYQALGEELEKNLKELSNSQEVKAQIGGAIKGKTKDLAKDDRRLTEVLSEDMMASIYKYLDENEERIGRAVRDNLKDPEIEEKMVLYITELLLQHMPKLILTFLSPDSISQKILDIIRKSMDNEDSNKYILILIRTVLEKILDRPISEFLNHVDLEKLDYEKLAEDILVTLNSEKNRKLIIQLMETRLREAEEGIKSNLFIYLRDRLDEIIESRQVEDRLASFLADKIEEFSLKPIGFFMEKINDEQINGAFNFLKSLFHKFAENELPKLIEYFNISQIVEDQINSFQVEFAEELILDIAHKELKAITWLGALLGGLIGILTPLLQVFY